MFSRLPSWGGLVWLSGVFLVRVGCEFLACIASPVVASPLIGTLIVRQCVCVWLQFYPLKVEQPRKLFGISFR